MDNYGKNIEKQNELHFSFNFVNHESLYSGNSKMKH